MLIFGLVTAGIIGGGIIAIGIGYLLYKALSSQPIDQLRKARANFIAARSRDDAAGMKRYAAEVRRIIAENNLTGAEAQEASADVAGY